MAIYIPLLAALILPQLVAGALALRLTGRARSTLVAATGAGAVGWGVYAAMTARGLAQAEGIGAVLLVPLCGAALGVAVATALLAARAVRRRVRVVRAA